MELDCQIIGYWLNVLINDSMSCHLSDITHQASGLLGFGWQLGIILKIIYNHFHNFRLIRIYDIDVSNEIYENKVSQFDILTSCKKKVFYGTKLKYCTLNS